MTNLPQENFERALASAESTLSQLTAGPAPDLRAESRQRLLAWLWEFEAIGAALRLELMNREERNPVDLG